MAKTQNKNESENKTKKIVLWISVFLLILAIITTALLLTLCDAKGDDVTGGGDTGGGDNPIVECEHNIEILPAVAPTCEEKGLTEGKKCSKCGEIILAQEEVSAIGHAYGQWESVDGLSHSRVCANDSTHVEIEEHNWLTYSCTCHSCGFTDHSYDDVWTDNGENHSQDCVFCPYATIVEDHDFQLISTTPATCEDPEIFTYQCVCGNTYTEEGAPATGHSWGEWSMVDENEHIRYCENGCYTAERSAHVVTDESRQYEPSCEYAGILIEWCALCGAVVRDEMLEPTGHDWSDWTDNGDGTCTRCCLNDSTHTETEPHVDENTDCLCDHCGSVEHDYPETWTDNGDGTHTKVCANGCGIDLTETHTYEETSRVDATCENDGSVTYTCVCGNTYTETLTALGHDYPDTWTDNGENHIKVCGNGCGVDLTEAHTHEETGRLDADCENDGIIIYTCVCNNIKAETIPATGHDYPDTCTDNGDGTHTKVCANGCGIDLTETHTYEETDRTPADCLNVEVITLTCACGNSFTEEGAPATGHDYSWIDNGDGTCTGTCANDSSHVEIADHIDDNTDELCDNCGADMHVHQWSQWTFNPDGTTHTRVCLLDDSHTETEDHTGMETDCTCDVCGVANHVTHDNNMTDCDKCGAIFNEITANAGDKVMFGVYNPNHGISDGVKMLDTSLDRFGKVIDISNGAFSFDPNRYALTIESAPGYEDSEGEYNKYFAYRTSYGKYLAIGEELIKVGFVETGILSLSDEINNNSTWLAYIYDDYSEIGYSIYVLTSTKYDELGFASYFEEEELDEDYFILFYNNIDTDVITVTYNYNNVNVGHDVTYTDNGDGTHTISCSICGIISENEPCYGGTATCTDKATCTGCGAGYGETTHTNIVIDNVVPATCTTTGLTAGSHCEDCGEVIVAQVVEPINENNHLWAGGGTDNLDGITHTRVCTYDPSHTIVESHSGARSCYCDVCGGEYHFTHDDNLSTCDGCSDYLFDRGSVPGGKVILYYSTGNMVFDASTPETFGKAIDNSGGKVFADLSRYLLTVEEGSISGSYAYKTPFGKYLAVSEEGQLIYIDEINDYSSWTNPGAWSGLTHAMRTDLVLGINEGQFCIVNGGWTGVCVFDFTNVNVGHEVTYTDNGDGTHTISCSICGPISDNTGIGIGKASHVGMDDCVCDDCGFASHVTHDGNIFDCDICGADTSFTLIDSEHMSTDVSFTPEQIGTETLKDGDKILIGYTYANNAGVYYDFSTEENVGYKTTLGTDKAGYVDLNKYLVEVVKNDDGTYSFLTNFGKYLAMDSTGALMCLDVINADSSWTIMSYGPGNDMYEAYITSITNVGQGRTLNFTEKPATRTVSKVGGTVIMVFRGVNVGHEMSVASNNDNTHTYTCTGCDLNAVEDCHGGTATCTDKAICDVCNSSYGDALGHAYPDTWTDNGENHIKVCANGCGIDLTETHTYEETGRTPADCLNVEVITLTCACGNSYTEEGAPATGHDYEYVDNGDGTHTKVCANGCGIDLTETHTYEETDRTPADCLNVEVITLTCACGNSFTEEGAPATGHNYPDTWTDNGDGTHIKVCANGCGINLVENHLADKKYHDNGSALYYATNKCSACGYYESLGEAVGSATNTYVSSESDFIDAMKYLMPVYLENDITITEPARILRPGNKHVHLQGHTLTATGVDGEGDGVMFYTSVDLRLNLYTEGGSFIVAPADDSVENAYIVKQNKRASAVTTMKVTIHAKDVGVDDKISTTGNTLFDIKVGTLTINCEDNGAYVNFVTNGNNPTLVKDDGDDFTTVAITVTGGKFQGIDVTEYVDTATYNVVNENGTFVVSKK